MKVKYNFQSFFSKVKTKKRKLNSGLLILNPFTQSYDILIFTKSL